jgi:hypothetical protein
VSLKLLVLVSIDTEEDNWALSHDGATVQDLVRRTRVAVVFWNVIRDGFAPGPEELDFLGDIMHAGRQNWPMRRAPRVPSVRRMLRRRPRRRGGDVTGRSEGGAVTSPVGARARR